ncbi:Uncharacterised protein [Mycobacteroides abscessus subsp. abscessus]|nr:Uncharacterised protein [Mycobacteroides abscessus subsp. abscessus]
MPLAGFLVWLRTRMLLRHAQVLPASRFGKPTPAVSPKAVSISPCPLSHMMPRSVPSTL